jgi:predicted TIM-barrel fold metal-dependent hydrolase
MDPTLFLPSLKVDYLLRGGTPEGRHQIEQMDGKKVQHFDDYVQFLGDKLREFKTLGAVALKTVTPYYRSFEYDEVPEDKARDAYRATGVASAREQKAVEDFAFHFVIQKAIELQLPVQIHTGLLAWNTTYLPYCNPTQLNGLFLRYPECRFVLFHGGYPYSDELGVLAKTFPNVFLDLCWLPWISMELTKRFLQIWLEIVPTNKFMWGGDAHRAECVHGHWLQAQQAVIEILGEKVKRGALDRQTAVRIVRGIFRENARSLFGIR